MQVELAYEDRLAVVANRTQLLYTAINKGLRGESTLPDAVSILQFLASIQALLVEPENPIVLEPQVED